MTDLWTNENKLRLLRLARDGIEAKIARPITPSEVTLGECKYLNPRQVRILLDLAIGRRLESIGRDLALTRQQVHYIKRRALLKVEAGRKTQAVEV